ncbi:unnamed protein product [Vitrella brassicaformis CCMP3155]|uniref:Cyclin-dependent kinase 2 homolog n=1 Tax=Vitrella brassicaformis (strain CCMP3155) TaxID=1169540 RepID=A0A0G4ETE8_VITBC|nr:unnamed protein product [Vitrella brassicaformis CCMP3155]|mmetsp:Transcript_21814/g.53463  ORF Transcript_21814/g.53463 Transcript_21814/m.53463 type:complete len:343 (-) Transcript_21814:176-1204(-)|eukprot:CEM01517.1 unnamed protein product [Vitrella brassicaformis CCMP3155]
MLRPSPCSIYPHCSAHTVRHVNVAPVAEALPTKFREGVTLGAGTYGTVRIATELSTGKKVALKTIQLEDDEGKQNGVTNTAIRELILLRALRHPNIVRCTELEADAKELRMVLEYCNRGDLRREIKKPGNLTITAIKKYARQVLSALAYMHMNYIVHRDLKPQNLLLDSSGDLKVGDFGLARCHVSPSHPGTHDVVSLWYRAPELLLRGAPSFAIDVWAVGCVVAEMCVKQPIFPGDSEIHTLYKIFELLGTPTNATWPGVESFNEYKDEFPQWRRPDVRAHLRNGLFADTPLKHDSQGVDLIVRLLTLCPEHRITAIEALSHPWLKDDSNPTPLTTTLKKK